MNIFHIHQKMSEKIGAIQALTAELLVMHEELKQSIPTIELATDAVPPVTSDWVAPAPPTNPDWVATTTIATDPAPVPDPIVLPEDPVDAEPPATE